jgi:hypothetical protein
MHQLYPDQGLTYSLKQIANGSGLGLYWQLYQNNFTPTLNSQLSDFTLATITWGRIQVPVAAFTLEQVAAHVGSIQAPNIVFTNSTGVIQVIYGYVILDATAGKVVGAARFDAAPITVPLLGTQTVTPILGDFSEFSS